MVNGKANHCGVSVPGGGFADNSLLVPRGAVVARAPTEGRAADVSGVGAGCEAAIRFLEQPGQLCAPILEQERRARGWHLTIDAPDFVRTLRSTRSLDLEDMNCVEWIVRALELGGRPAPMSIMTPTELLHWCEAGCPETDQP